MQDPFSITSLFIFCSRLLSKNQSITNCPLWTNIVLLPLRCCPGFLDCHTNGNWNGQGLKESFTFWWQHRFFASTLRSAFLLEWWWRCLFVIRGPDTQKGHQCSAEVVITLPQVLSYELNPQPRLLLALHQEFGDLINIVFMTMFISNDHSIFVWLSCLKAWVTFRFDEEFLSLFVRQSCKALVSLSRLWQCYLVMPLANNCCTQTSLELKAENHRQN